MAGCCTNKIIDTKPLSARTRQWINITCTLNGSRTHRGASYYMCDAAGKKDENQRAAVEQRPRVRSLLRSQCALSATRKLIQTKEVKLTHFLYTWILSRRSRPVDLKTKNIAWRIFVKQTWFFSWKCEDRPRQIALLSYELIIQSFPIKADLHSILFVARLIIAVFVIATVPNSLRILLINRGAYYRLLK